jgi:Protein of unknown function (DUF3181)
MAQTNTTEIIEALAAEIGDNIYIDIAKWHLFLRDAKIHTLVAQELYPLITSNKAINENDVTKIIKSVPIKIGGGRNELSLIDLLPLQCQVSLVDILEKFQRDQ